MGQSRAATLAHILYLDACYEAGWPHGVEPWETMAHTKRIIYVERAVRILERVDNITELRLLA